MTGLLAPLPAPPEPLVEALASAFGALLADADVDALVVVEDGAVVVTRRGRRETLDVDPGGGALTEALTAAGIDDDTLAYRMEDGGQLTAARLADGRWALSVARAAFRPVGMAAVIESGLLPPEEATALMEALLAGRSVVIGGPCRWGARQLAAALADQASQAMTGMILADAALGALAPAPAGESAQARTRLARALGASFVLADGLSRDEVRALSGVDIVLIATSRAPPARLREDGEHLDVVVVGFSPEGAPELKAAGRPAAPVVTQMAMVPPAAAPSSARPVAALTPAPAVLRPGAALVAEVEPPGERELPPLKPLPPGPPQGWATPDDDGPGWELDDDGLPPAFDSFPGELGASYDDEGDDESAAGAAFSEVLRGTGGTEPRPTFTPRPPAEHPQTRQLKTDPLGGMTLEPPGPNPRGDE